MVVFTMLLPFLNDKKKAKIVCLGGMILAGYKYYNYCCNKYFCFGGGSLSSVHFSLIITVGKIQIADFIERLDVLFMLYLIIGGFFKIAIYFMLQWPGLLISFNLKTNVSWGFQLE